MKLLFLSLLILTPLLANAGESELRPHGIFSSDEIFTHLDRDKDGFLSKSEYNDGVIYEDTIGIDKVFNCTDKNGDQRLSRAEYNADETKCAQDKRNVKNYDPNSALKLPGGMKPTYFK